MKTSLKIISSCLAAAFALGACPALLSADENQVQCYHSPRYLVVGKDLQAKGGTDFLIKYKAEPDEKPACRYVVEDGDFEIKNEWAEYFAALTGNLLLLDSSTGPGPSGLTIWDLVERRKVYQGSWSGPMEIKDDAIIYWTETGEASDDNCPERLKWQLHGLGAAIETKVILHLRDFTVSKTNETRCSPRQ